MATPHQRHSDPDKARAFRGVQHQPFGFAHDVVDRHHARQTTRDDHRDHRDLDRRDTGVFRSGFRMAVGADLIPQPRAPDQHPQEDTGRNCHQKRDIGGRGLGKLDPKRGKDIMQRRQFGRVRKARRCGVHAALGAQHIDQNIVQHRGRDKVEHDRGDNDMAAPFGLQERGDRGPGGAEHGSHRRCTDQGQRPMGPRDIQTGQRHAQTAQHRLAFTTDIEQPRVKGDGNAKAGEHEVRGVIQRIAPAIGAAQSAGHHQFDGRNGVFPDAQNDQRRQDRCQQ